MKLKSYLSHFYQKTIPDNILQSPWQEIEKCNSCIMACGDAAVYDVNVKCCSYFPFIPNFLVGDILLNNPEVAPLIRQLILKKEYILPIGLCAPPDYQLKYAKKKVGDFGNDKDLLCMFFDDGNCKAWGQRNSECISFQCYSSYGKSGIKMWTTLGDILYDIEQEVCQQTMIEMGYSKNQVEQCSLYIDQKKFEKESAGKKIMAAAEWSTLWQHHEGAIDTYFIECYKVALQLVTSESYTSNESYPELVSLLK